MRVGHVQDARIAEAFEIVDADTVRAARYARQDAGKRGSAREVKKVSAADGHARSPPFAKAHFLPRLVSSKGSCLAKARV